MTCSKCYYKTEDGEEIEYNILKTEWRCPKCSIVESVESEPLPLHSELSDGLSAKEKEIERLETLLNPRLWDQEMHKAWHENLPDVQASFDALKECGR